MATNQYFQHYTATNEQDLIESLIVESIQTTGLDVTYIEREQLNVDYLYNEDPTNAFNQSTVIEMYPASVDGFDGDGEMFTSFGIDIKKTATFIVSKKRFGEELPLLTRPREGDLIYMPVTNTLLEVKFVNNESPFFEKGKQYVYELKLETFEYSYEDIQTNDFDIDQELDDMFNPQPETIVEDYGDNDDLDADPAQDINFDPSNPFGVR
jgi:hypothetical protein